MHAGIVREAEVKELDAWKSFGVSILLGSGNFGESAIDTRWVLARKMVEGAKTAEARQAAKSFQNPNLQGGVVDTSRCVSSRSSHL